LDWTRSGTNGFLGLAEPGAIAAIESMPSGALILMGDWCASAARQPPHREPGRASTRCEAGYGDEKGEFVEEKSVDG